MHKKSRNTIMVYSGKFKNPNKTSYSIGSGSEDLKCLIKI